MSRPKGSTNKTKMYEYRSSNGVTVRTELNPDKIEVIRPDGTEIEECYVVYDSIKIQKPIENRKTPYAQKERRKTTRRKKATKRS